jgi:hypothetical protein
MGPRNRRTVGLRNDERAGQTWDCSSVGLWAYDGRLRQTPGEGDGPRRRWVAGSAIFRNGCDSSWLWAVVLWAYRTVGLRFGLDRSCRGGPRWPSVGPGSPIQCSSSRDAWRSSFGGGASFNRDPPEPGVSFAIRSVRLGLELAWCRSTAIRKTHWPNILWVSKTDNPLEADRALRWMHHRVAV